ncbi:MAG: hypothetical protein ACXW3M_02885 [Rhodoplanes sp.]
MMRSKSKKEALSEECGKSWGESLQRASITPEADMREAARRFAEQIPNQEIGPLAYVLAEKVRSIRDARKPDQQLIVILDDGCPVDPGHAVMRLVDGLDKSYFAEARKQLLQAFTLKN